MSNRRRASAVDESNSVYVEDLKLGEQFSIALSSKGVIYAWGQNDLGQLGLGHEQPVLEPMPITGISKQITRIDCGLKHCVALTKDY